MGLIDGAKGGDIMNGIGQMLDPAGIFATGREGGIEGVVRNILDPLGIFGGIGKSSAPPVDADQQVDQLFQPDTVVDLKEKEKANDKDRTKDKDSSKMSAQSVPAATEMPPIDEVDGKGYAKSKSNSAQKPMSRPSSKPAPSARSTQEEGKTNGHTGKEGPSKQLQRSISAAAASQARTQEEEMREVLRHLQALRAHINHVSGDDFDGKFSMQNLRQTVADPKSTHGEKAAAQYLIDHEEIFTSLINLSNCGSGCASEVGLDKLSAALQKKLENPPPTSKPPKKDPPIEAKPPPDETPPVDGPPVTKDDGDKANGTPPKPPKNRAKSVGFEGALSNLDHHLNELEDEMAKLTDQMIKGADPKATAKEKAEGASAQSKLSMLNLRYQQFINIRREMYELLSNVKKTFDDMSMRAINNIR